MSAADEQIRVETGSRSRRRSGWLIAIGTIAAVLLISAPHAEGGTYKVYECNNEVGGAAGTPDGGSGWGGHNSGGLATFTLGNWCPFGFHTDQNPAGLVVYDTGGGNGSSGSWAIWEVYVPANLRATSVRWSWRLCDWKWGNPSASGGAYIASWAANGGGYVGPVYASPQYGCNAGVASRADEGVDRVGVGAWCPVSVCVGGQNVAGYIGDMVFTLLDSSPPRLASLHGSLLAGGPRAGLQRLQISASDQGAGVRGATVKVNGQQVASPTSACSLASNGVANRMVPCPGSANYSLDLDTARAPWHEGENTVEICTYEFSTDTPPGSECASRTVLIDNSCADSQGAVGQGAQLTGGLARSAQDAPAPRLLVRSNQSATIRGTLRGFGGAVRAANICLYEQIDAPAEIRRLVQVTKTRSDGGFTLQVPAGPSRAYDVVYRNDSSVLERKALYLEAVAVPTLRVRGKRLTNGKSARFNGMIPGPRAAHRTVGLQALVGKRCRKAQRGKRSRKPKGPRCRLKWRTFKVLTTDDAGRFRGKYRFTQTKGRARYRFRAIVKKQNGYPYSPGASAEQQVRVRGTSVRDTR